jgi:hypothetical protein
MRINRKTYRAFTLHLVPASRPERCDMLDVILSLLTMLLFVATIGYAVACDRL